MRRIFVLMVLLGISNFVKAGLDATLNFGLYADGVQGSSSNLVLQKGKFTFTLKNETLGCTKTEADASAMGLSVTETGTRNTIKIATRVFDDCGAGAAVGNIITFTITINNPGTSLHGRTASIKFKLAAGSHSFFKNPNGVAGYTQGVSVIDLTASGVDKYGFNFVAPPPTINVTGASLCAGETGKTVKATFTNAPADMTGYTIDWGIAGITTSGAISAAGATGSINPATVTATKTGQAKLKKADGTVVATSANYTVTVNPLPTITIAPTEVCQGAQITASGGGTYKWTAGATGSSNKVTPASTGNYTVEVTSAQGCKATKTQAITVNLLPSVNPVANPAAVCKGSQAELKANASGGSGSGYTYCWQSGSSKPTSFSQPEPYNFTVNSNGTYYAFVKDSKGCISQGKSVSLTAVTVTATLSANPTSVPNGGTSVLTAGASGGTAPYSYTWTGITATGNTVTTPKLSANTTYKVVAEDANHCRSAEAICTVNVSGGEFVVNPSDKEVCSAALPTALSAGAGGGSTTYTYTWKAPAGVQLSSTTNATPNVLASSTPGTYTVEVEVKDTGINSTKTGTLQLKIKESPVLSNVKADPASVFIGGTSELSATVVPGGSTLEWSGGPLASTSGTRVNTTALSTTANYTVKAKNDGCEATANVSVTVTGSSLAVTPPANPPHGYIDTPFDATVTVTGGAGGYTYTWTSSDPGVTLKDKGNGTVEVTSSTTGTKEVCVEVKSGTETKKECFNVIVTDPSVVGLVMSVDKKCAYDGEYLTITITGNGANTYSFVLRDQSGNEVMRVTDKASWDPHHVYAEKAGTYRITDFKYKISGVESTGEIPEPVIALFDPVPIVKANAEGLANINHCEGELLTLKGYSDEKGLQYSWDNGVADGVPFTPTASGIYTVTATNPVTKCVGTSTVDVTLSPRPTVQAPPQQEICAGELVTLTATAGADVVDIKWSNNVDNDVPFRPTLTATYEVTVTNDGGCTATDSTTVIVKPAPEIWRNSKNPRNIAIGKDVYFAVSVEGEVTYQWKKKEGDEWVELSDVTNSAPIIIGSHTDSISLLTVPQSWDGSEFRVVVSNECGADSMEFQLGVKECFEISAELVMDAGIIPDEDPGNLIDGWYCRGRAITLKAMITSEEGYDIENAHYKWTIDGLELPEEHVELVSDTAILTWIPQFTEDDIVVKVGAYCDGACEEVYPQRLRLKSREFEDVAMKIMTDKDPEHRFCAGDTVNFWVSTRNAGKAPQYTWYNDVFELPEEHSPKNELLAYDSSRVVMVMGQEDTWMRVVLTPSNEICVKEPVVIDTVFMKKKPWMEPKLSIDCSDTLVCRGDSVSMLAIQSDAGSNPTFQWQRSIGAPFPDWNLGTDYFATVFADEEDMWIKCTMTPSDDICYDQTKPIVEAIKISVFKDSSEVTITCDMEDKLMGDELIFEAEVKNLLGEPRYEWYVNEMKSPCTEAEFITNAVTQGDVVYCLVSGDKTCQTRIRSNEIIVDFGHINRDTMIVIYKNERVKDLDMLKEGDDLTMVLFKIDMTAKFGIGTITTDGKFNYTPMAGFVGTDEVKYVIVNRKDKSVVAEGYIYITVKENDRFFVPNIITPNGDGINDTWQLDFLSEYPNHLIQVFDRSGRIVFEARNYQNDWDGRGMTKSGYVGQINLVNGIYTYFIDLGDKNKTVLKSWIEIRANLNRRNYR